jgi:hypothetical protein
VALQINGGTTTETPLSRYPHESEAMPVMDVQPQTLGPGYRQVLWLPDAKPMRRAAAARIFARGAESIEGVREVWLLDTSHDLEVAVVLADANLDCEMGLRGSFIEIVCDQLSGREGELSVYALENVPNWVREGKRL